MKAKYDHQVARSSTQKSKATFLYEFNPKNIDSHHSFIT